MELLQKMLDYRFWILAALTPILALVAWKSGAGSMAYAVQQRTSFLSNTFNQVEQLAGNDKQANPKWKAAVDTVLQEATKDKSETWEALYEQQEDLFQWPAKEIAEAVAKLNEGEEIDQMARSFYGMRDYGDAFNALEAKLLQIRGNPANPVVDVPDGLLQPFRRAFGQSTPSTQEIFEAQEDIWVLSLLLDVIQSINGDAAEGFQAAIQEILELQIGDLVKRSAAGGKGGLAQGNQQFGNQFGGGQQGMAGNEQQAGPRGLGQQQQPAGANADLDALATSGRYTETETYKSMRFRMLLMMKHQEVPRLLSELINHPVPITISVLHIEGPDFVGQPGRTNAPDTKLPDMARVEIVGQLKLFKKPPQPAAAAPLATAAGQPAPGAGQAAPQTPGAAGGNAPGQTPPAEAVDNP